MRLAQFAALAILSLALLAAPLAVEAQQAAWDQHMRDADAASREGRWTEAETSWNVLIREAEVFGPTRGCS